MTHPTEAGERERLAKNLRTQDNRATAHPIFAVQQRVRDYGLEDGDEWEWRNADDDWRLAAAEKAVVLEAKADTGEDTSPWVRAYYRDRWEFVQPFFTEAAAESYIEANRHNLTDPRVYVYSGHRNREWQMVRDLLRTEPSGEAIIGAVHPDTWEAGLPLAIYPPHDADEEMGQVRVEIRRVRPTTPVEPEPWQPMETAPKDGTVFLALLRGDPVLCAWNTRWYNATTGEWGQHFQPTRWTPVPPVPDAAPPDSDPPENQPEPEEEPEPGLKQRVVDEFVRRSRSRKEDGKEEVEYFLGVMAEAEPREVPGVPPAVVVGCGWWDRMQETAAEALARLRSRPSEEAVTEGLGRIIRSTREGTLAWNIAHDLLESLRTKEGDDNG